MNREQLREQALRLNSLLDDLWNLESVQATTNQIVLSGDARVPIPDFEVTANGRLLAAGYQQARIEHVPTYQSPWRLLITVTLARSVAQTPWLNIGLFAGTVATMIWINDLVFAICLTAILLSHEFGHYIAARRYGMDPTWPFFIPSPPLISFLTSPFGTFGAFIRLRAPIRDRKALLDMAAAGPLAGFVVAAVLLTFGIAHSSVVARTAGQGYTLGDSLLLKFLMSLFFPGLGEHQDVLLNSMAYAGWAGMLVTMLNLLPMAQLDGGHISYALFRGRQRWVAMATLVGLAVASIWSVAWLVWFAIGIILRPAHPPTLMDDVPLGRGRVLIGWLALVIFVICFMPVPFSIN